MSTTLADYPDAPSGALISAEGWLVVGEEAWTPQEWRRTPPKMRPSRRDPTAHQVAVLKAVLRHDTAAAAAQALGISEQTVKNTLVLLRKNLRVRTTAQAVARLAKWDY